MNLVIGGTEMNLIFPTVCCMFIKKMTQKTIWPKKLNASQKIIDLFNGSGNLSFLVFFRYLYVFLFLLVVVVFSDDDALDGDAHVGERGVLDGGRSILAATGTEFDKFEYLSNSSAKSAK